MQNLYRYTYFFVGFYHMLNYFENSGLEAPKSRSGGVLEASMGVLERLGSIWGCRGEFRAVFGASWEYLEPSGKRLGVV